MPSGEVVLSISTGSRRCRSEYRRKAALATATTTRRGAPWRRRSKTLEPSWACETDVDDLREQLQGGTAPPGPAAGPLQRQPSRWWPPQRLWPQLRESIAWPRQQDKAPNNNAPQPDNPAYILLDTQLQPTNSEIRSLEGKLRLNCATKSATTRA